MKIEDDNFNDGSASQNSIDPLENNIRYRLRKNPNKTKNLYVDELIEKKTKKKGENSSGLSEKDICRTILDIVKKDEKSFLFRQPAIRAFTNQKDKEYYKRTIKEPRDLGGITKKLKTPKYSPKEFYEDMELCWSNAQLFNENNTVVYHDAVYLKELCNKLYKEYGLFDIINKEKEIESNTNINSNDSNSFNDKNKNENKDKDNKSNESRTKDKSENISINSNKSNNDTESYNNNDSSYSSELKNNKMIGKKRKRKKKEEVKNIETTIKEDEEELDDKNDNEKKINKQKGRKKRSKLAIDEVKEMPVAKTKKSKNKISFEDIKKKFPINFPVISDLNDINKMSHKRKSISQNRGNNTRNLLSTNNSKNHQNSGNNFNKKKQTPKVQNSKNNFNINMIGENDKRRIAYEFIMDIFKSKFPIQNFETQKNNDKNIYDTYEPERHKIECQELAKYDNNCNNENVHKMETKIQKKKQSNNSDFNKNNYAQNMNNINSNINSGRSMNNIINISDKVNDQKDEKKMQLRVEIAKYFDNLSDNNMIELLVYIENIRPQSIRILDNDTIYIDMEAFNEETFNKVFEFVKKFV